MQEPDPQPQPTSPTTQTPLTPKKANIILYFLLVVLFLCFVGVIFYLIGILPLPIVIIATAVGALVAVISAVIQAFEHFLSRVWKSAQNHSKIILLSLFTAILLMALLVLAPITLTRLTKLRSSLSPIASSTSIPTIPTTKSNFPSTQTVVSVHLQPLLRQQVPYCNDSAGWTIPPNMEEGTPSFTCTSSGLILQQYSPSKSHYAELDLTSVNNKAYNQSAFHIQVQVAFQQDDIYTYGSLLVQTPAGHSGGYILAVNNRGDWQLQDANDILHPKETGTVNVSGKFITLNITVQNGWLTGSVNSQPLTPLPDSLSSGIVGLLVEKTGAVQSSPVIYSNFELDSIS